MIQRLGMTHALSWAAIGLAAAALVAAFAISAGLTLGAIDTAGRLDWPGGAGTIGYESPHGGPLLQPTLDDLKAAARRSPEARNPTSQLSGEDYYAARGLGGWRLALWSAVALGCLTGYRLARCTSARGHPCGLSPAGRSPSYSGCSCAH